ncbi:hypothetical protein Tco_0085708 [Tanacetum coccineum]
MSKLPILKKSGVIDIWAMEMSISCIIFDNNVWKVIHRMEIHKKRISQLERLVTLRRFHELEMQIEIWWKHKTSSEGLEKGYDRFQQLLSQLEAHGAELLISYFLQHIQEREVPAGFADEVIYSLFSNQSEDLDLLHEDLEQIDDVDIKEMDINWQIAMIAIRMKKFYKKTGRRVRIDGKKPVGFDKKDA